MRVLLVTIGSNGDVHPFIALGRAFRAKEHEATILANPYFQRQIEEEGLGFRPLGEHVDLGELLRKNAASMDSLRGPMVVMRGMILPAVPDIIRATTEAIDAIKPDIVLSHGIALGASWACERRGVPCGIVTLSPISWFNANEPLVMLPFRSETPSRRAVAFDLWMGRLLTGLLLDRPLNRVRREMGLPKQKRILYTNCRGGAINLALWSPQFRGPLAGDPAMGVICGFPWHDRHRANESDHADLMAFVHDGEPPLVFTMGTTMVHLAGRFYQHAARAAAALGRRAVLLVGREEYAPHDLPRGVRAFAYAPYSLLLPMAAATIHHGGIGSTAQALRAGKPTLIVPASHDQFDNAARCKRLGLSETLPVKRVTASRLHDSLSAILDDCEHGRAIQARCAAMASSLRDEDGAARAAAEVERLVRG